MAYRITYEKQTIKRSPLNTKYKFPNIKKILALMISIVMLLTLLNTKTRKHLLPGDPEVTERALNNMVVNIREGEPFVDVMTDFCTEILENA